VIDNHRITIHAPHVNHSSSFQRGKSKCPQDHAPNTIAASKIKGIPKTKGLLECKNVEIEMDKIAHS